ncbi:multiheme c-type cytochrome [Hydrogenimonas urashimensis]|uniref:multiheme c-type cytochrome n=1 Tax=Hydrogenimonas urashimensis TaxID=2740515 RepID=UPI0019155B2D|nr:multiheme c-type cytochrome [Hydrogenimonas urashimensis]
MKKTVLLVVIAPLLYAVYLTNKSCKECHEEIYDEYEHSYHSKTYFNDELHRKVADRASMKKYDCGACHMPAATNIDAMDQGKARPNPIHQEQKDAISCFYCHEIAYVKKAHKRNIIVLAKQAAGYKPTLYGSLENPDESDKHAMVKSPIYDRYVCMGCHSHKYNDHDLLIFQGMDEKQESKECIKCHMPYVRGGVEKMNKRARTKHRSHRFPGIHSRQMREKSVEMNVTASAGGDEIVIKITNQMAHPLIIQAARMKYLDISIMRNGKTIWRNFKKSPYEDSKGCFVIEFTGKDGEPVVIPSKAYGYGFKNNLRAKESRSLHYKVSSLKRDDKIIVSMWAYLTKPSCWDTLQLKEKSLMEPYLMKKIVYEVK